MLKVEDMSPADMHALLQRQNFGHLGCSRDGRPYVVPMRSRQTFRASADTRVLSLRM